MRLPNGFGGISRLKGNRRKPYAVRITQGWTDEGRQIIKYLGYYTTRADALKALSAYNANPYDLSGHDTTMSELFKLWEDWIKSDKGREVDNIYYSALHYSKSIQDMKFADIRKRHIQAVIDNCPKGYATKKNIKGLFTQLFRFAIDRELVQTNYATLCELPAKEMSGLHKPFTEEEIDVLWSNLNEPAVRFALVYIYTGLRPAELLQIKTENVFIEKKYMTGGMKTAAGKNRVIPIADKIMPIVKEWYSPDNEYLCVCEKDGKPVLNYDRLRYHYWQSCELLKGHHPHDCRHTCATMLDNAEVAPKTIKLILGHSSNDVTERVYTHKTINQLIEAINKI
jgi:integrase